MTLKLIIDATVEPVTLAEAKDACVIDSDITAFDTKLTRHIQTAREECEHELGGQSLLTQTWERVIDAFPEAEIELGMPSATPIGTAAAIVSIKYIDTAGAEQTMSPADYTLDADTTRCWALPAIDTEWPDTLDTANAVRVRFTAGSALAANLPSSIKDWILLRVAALRMYPEGMSDDGRAAPLPDRFHARLLDRYRRWVV